MISDAQILALTDAVQQAENAMIKCDAEALERVATGCEDLADNPGPVLRCAVIGTQQALIEGVRSFGLLLAHAEGTLRLLRTCQKGRSAQLEYLPMVSHGE
ncbi:MAG: hypothetical protein JST28_06540 [Acidobacteria bacterium]|nr:hypothetical protein [Acidobacteriota bacterium]